MSLCVFKPHISKQVVLINSFKIIPSIPYFSNKLQVQAGAKLGQAQLKLGLDFTFAFSESSPRMEKSHPMVPPFDHFQGKNKNC